MLDFDIMAIRYLIIFPAVLMLSSCSLLRHEIAPESSQGKAYAVASWYGKDFHGRPTSSGETFNMYALTCAHKSHPFGTRLKVTHVNNGKAVECIVNDRGPFVEGRDIDLSYAAAKEIGLIGPGISNVFLEVNGRDESYIKQVKVQVTDRTGPFAIQIGSFADNANALRLKTALALKYKNVYIQEAEVKGTLFYRVRIGNFATLGSSESAAGQLGEEGYSPIVVKADVRI